MTDTEKQQMNVAIAEAMGWKWYRIPHWGPSQDKTYRSLFLPAVHEYEGQDPRWIIPANGTERICTWDYMQRDGHVLDYTGSLDAMATAEATLTIADFATYELALCDVVDASGADSDIWFYVLTATAAQRAEAFCRLRKIGPFR